MPREHKGANTRRAYCEEGKHWCDEVFVEVPIEIESGEVFLGDVNADDGPPIEFLDIGFAWDAVAHAWDRPFFCDTREVLFEDEWMLASIHYLPEAYCAEHRCEQVSWPDQTEGDPR